MGSSGAYHAWNEISTPNGIVTADATFASAFRTQGDMMQFLSSGERGNER